MIRKRLNMIFSSKLFFILFSIVVSFALWMYVEINENQIISYTVPNVRVVRLNEELLNDRNMLVASMNPDSVTLRFESPRSVASKLTTRDALYVAIDLGDITSRGSIYRQYEIIYPPDVDINLIENVSMSVERISLRIDRLQTNPGIPVEVIYAGGVAEGYSQELLQYGPQNVTISGPADVVSQVNRAQVNITGRENLTQTLEGDFGFVLLDENGEQLRESLLEQLTIREDTIHVTIPVKMTQVVTLAVEPIYGSGANSSNTEIVITPNTIEIAGEPEDVIEITSITLGTINLTRFEASNTYSFPINLPERIARVSGETQATVYVEVHNLSISHLTVPNTNIHVANEPTGHTVQIRSLSVDVRLRGLEADLINVTEEDVRVVATIPDAYTVGIQRVSARVYVDGTEADIGAVGTYDIIVNIAVAIEDGEVPLEGEP